MQTAILPKPQPLTTPEAAPAPITTARVARARRKVAGSVYPEVLPFELATKRVLTGEELSVREVAELLDFASLLKKQRAVGNLKAHLQGKQLALIFEKPSLRTRVSFQVGMNELGGASIEIVSNNRKSEEPEDTARVLEGYCQGIMARTFEHSTIERMAQVTKAVVVNGLSDLHHPCQGFADILTLKERFGTLKGIKLAYVGDGNNVLHSLLLLLPFMGGEVRFACPEGYGPNAEIVARAQARAAKSGGKVVVCKTPEEAVAGVHAIYTDVWTSMGFEAENAKRVKDFAGYQVNEKLHALADKGAVVMHCLPMIRGQEISKTLPDQPCSAIFQQSENRLHVQKALLVGMMA
jgi:ornithine carbamoyltransferase